MSSLKMYLVFILLLAQTCFVSGQDIVKSSLTFVIDNTGSMRREIAQVIKSTNSLFDAVTASNDSQIENFILVTFKDPDVTQRIVTNEREAFKNALNSIKVSGGLGDCWEYSMTGIKLGLEQSLPQSLLYVYTDATAKDYWLYKEVESLALRKHIPVSFLLTGDCRTHAHEAVAEELYNDMAKATGGDVFNVMKGDISEINKYIVEKVKGRDNILLSKTFPPGYGHKVTYTVDNKMGDLMFILVGDKSNVTFTGPNGTIPATEVLVKKSGVTITKLPKPATGVHTAIFGSKSETGIKLIGKTTVNIEPGFSPFKPESFNDTSTMPGPDGNIFLAVKLHGEGVNLKTAQILDMDGNVIKNVTLQLVDKDSKFYVTEEFDPPKTKFLLSVYGYDEKDNSTIKRDGSTPLARRDLKYEKSENIAPIVTIENAPEVIIDNEAPLRLRCKVHGYPQPEIVWVNKDTGNTTAATVLGKDVADFIGMLDIDKIENNCTYECTAKNIIGENTKNIRIGIRAYFKVVEVPEEQIHTKYGEEARIVCKVDAQPKATITWHKDDKLLSSDDNIQVSSDMTTVTIKHVNMEAQGEYVCEAKNDLEAKEFNSNVTVTGLTAPVINKTNVQIEVLQETDGLLVCQITDGVPPPTRQWLFQREGVTTYEKLNETAESLHLKNASDKDIGTYKCVAINPMGSDEYAVNLILNYPPSLSDDHDKDIIVQYGNAVTILCDANGIPSPTVIWSKNGTELTNTTNIKVVSNNSLMIQETTIADIGLYTCEAKNKHGSDKKVVNIDVFASPTVSVESPPEIAIDYDAPLQLKCNVHGYPQPNIVWQENETGVISAATVSAKDGADYIGILNVDKINRNSTYECKAKNSFGEDNANVKVRVITYFKVIETPKEQIDTKYGEEARVVCKVDAQPKATMTWHKDDSPLSSDDNVQISSDMTTVTIKHVNIESQGKYSCKAINDLESKAFYSNITITGLSSPTINKTSADIDVLKGTGGQFLCPIIGGTPPPARQWLFQRQGDAIFEKLADTGEILHVNNATDKDVGTYKCVVSNSIGSDQHAMNLILNYPPTIRDDHDKSKQVKYGENVTILCDVSGVPSPTVTWSKNGKEIMFTKNINVVANNSLVILKTTIFDIGVYTCEAKNKHGADKKEVNVDVFAVPTVTIDNAPDIVIDYDAPLQLTCNVHGYPQPDIVWQEKKTGVISAATVTLKGAADFIGILNIDKVKEDAAYECKATNSFGEDNTNVTIDVITYFNVKETPKGKIYAKYDEEALLVCEIDAQPKATITWRKDGKPLSGETNIQISSDMTTVTIKHVNMDTQGKYVCEAKNDLQKKLFYSDVIVTGLLAPVINKTSTEIHVLEGSVAQFTCQIVDGLPPPTRQWFFQKQGSVTFDKVDETGEILHVKNASDINVGTYKCGASNLMGSEYYAVDLILNYAPNIINDNITFIPVKNGEMLIILCDANGVPKPTVTWSKNEEELVYTRDLYTTANNTLKIRSTTITDTGTYTCEAKNKYGSDKKVVDVEVFVPVNINIPEMTTFVTLVDRDLLMSCDAGGYPTPETKWTYQDFEGKLVPNEIRSDVKTNSLTLRRVQLKDEGYYTCIASNAYSSSNITFKVEVNAPPVIENAYTSDTFSAVKGDLVLRIPCKATGKPEPTIVWKRNNLNIPIGSEWYDIDNGSLIIKNVDEKAQGEYWCFAENKIGNDSMVFDVIVDDYPSPGTSTIHKKLIEGGKAENINCDIPHKLVDLLRWYKNGKLIKTGELILNPVKATDEGIYSCRVSNMTESVSEHFRLSVGYKPRFVSEVDTVLNVVQKDSLLLDCEATAEPAAKVTWKLDNKTLDVDDMLYEIVIDLDNIGAYTCEVENGLGSINRTFTLIFKGCIMDLQKDFPSTNRPLMLTPSLLWPTLEAHDHYLVLNKSDLIYLHCPKSFTLFPAEYVLAFCEHESKVKISGIIYEYSEIKCKKETDLTIQSTDSKCLPGPGDTELLHIGYTVQDIFVKVYEVCLDKTNKVPLYTQHELSSTQYNLDNNITNWSRDTWLPFHFDSIYDCSNQADRISSTLGTDFHRADGCCFGKRQLVSPRDLHPGIPTAAAYTYLNVVPHWSTCNTKNWFDIEQRIRKLAISFRNSLTISTGTANTFRMGSHSYPTDIRLYDHLGRNQPVAEYIWKVVIYREKKHITRGLAIIQVNVPDLSKEEASSYILCKDICEEISWMRGTDWTNVADGFTFCCSVPEFQSKFRFFGQFNRGRIGILRDVFSYS